MIHHFSKRIGYSVEQSSQGDPAFQPEADMDRVREITNRLIEAFIFLQIDRGSDRKIRLSGIKPQQADKTRQVEGEGSDSSLGRAPPHGFRQRLRQGEIEDAPLAGPASRFTCRKPRKTQYGNTLKVSPPEALVGIGRIGFENPPVPGLKIDILPHDGGQFRSPAGHDGIIGIRQIAKQIRQPGTVNREMKDLQDQGMGLRTVGQDTKTENRSRKRVQPLLNKGREFSEDFLFTKTPGLDRPPLQRSRQVGKDLLGERSVRRRKEDRPEGFVSFDQKGQSPLEGVLLQPAFDPERTTQHADRLAGMCPELVDIGRLLGGEGPEPIPIDGLEFDPRRPRTLPVRPGKIRDDRLDRLPRQEEGRRDIDLKFRGETGGDAQREDGVATQADETPGRIHLTDAKDLTQDRGNHGLGPPRDRFLHLHQRTAFPRTPPDIRQPNHRIRSQGFQDSRIVGEQGIDEGFAENPRGISDSEIEGIRGLGDIDLKHKEEIAFLPVEGLQDEPLRDCRHERRHIGKREGAVGIVKNRVGPRHHLPDFRGGKQPVVHRHGKRLDDPSGHGRHGLFRIESGPDRDQI